MRLLVLTQAVDVDHPAVGFFPGWIEALAREFTSVEVVALYVGTHSLPDSVVVHSLGKESRPSRVRYVVRLFRTAVGRRNSYDAVFVHMNQEYVLLAGWLWRLLGKRVYLWRNHYAGSKLTNLAAFFCTKVFCTSKHSYTAAFKKTELMPVGIDLSTFVYDSSRRPERSVLFLARLAPSKHPELLLEAVAELAHRGIEVRAALHGAVAPGDAAYVASLARQIADGGLAERVTIGPPVANRDTPGLYSRHRVFVNCSRSGMYDKTIFEALACGTPALASSADYREAADPRLWFDGTATDLADKLEAIVRLPDGDYERLARAGRELAETQSLRALTASLAAAIDA